jgi:hypothetical protein
MAIIVDIDHEGGNLGEYDTTVADGGDLSVHSDAALAGTDYGLKLVVDDTNSIWVEKNISLSTNELRWRVFLDPNNLIMLPYNRFDWFQVRLSAYPNIGAYIQLQFATILKVAIIVVMAIVLMVSTIPIVAAWKVSGVQKATLTGLGLIPVAVLVIHLYIYKYYLISFRKRVAAFGVQGDGTHVIATDWVTITDTEHCFELHLERASSSVAGDGRLRMWIDGHLEGTASNLDNYDLWPNIAALRMGAVSGLDVGTSGTFYLDGLKANDDGSMIGCPVIVIFEYLIRFLWVLWRRFLWTPSLKIHRKNMA